MQDDIIRHQTKELGYDKARSNHDVYEGSRTVYHCNRQNS